MGFILMLHSIIRWLIVAVGLIGMVKFGIGWFKKQEFKSMDRGIGSAFSGLIDLQILLGVLYLFGTGFSTQRIEHAVTLIIAAVVAHLPVRWKMTESEIRFRNTFFSILTTLVLIFLGVAIVNGWDQ